MIFSGTGSAPFFKRVARSWALCSVKFPLIWPEPPQMASRMTGALITLPSKTMANSFPTLVFVASQKRLPPIESKVKATTG